MEPLIKPWFVIINPTSGNGTGEKKWSEIKRLLNHYKFNFSFSFTKHPKHSIELVKQAIGENVTQIISIGGDGTLHNIVNGIMTQTLVPSQNVRVGVIPIGTGNDWVKTHGIPKHIEGAIRIIKKGNLYRQDLGRIEFIKDSKPAVFFNNLAGVGFDGYVVNKIKNHKHIGPLAYLFGAILSLFTYKNFDSITYINSDRISGKTLMILVGLCKYSGGGMQLTKNPDPFDGLLDISIAKNLSKLDIIKNVWKLFNGKITTIKKVQSLKSNVVKIEIEQKESPFIQADGELIGSGDFYITLIPKAFSFYA